VLAFGVVLVAVGVLLAVVEAHLSTGGLLGGVAAVALIGGATLSLAGAGAGLPLTLVLVALIAVASTGGLTVLRRTLRSVRRQRPRVGVEAMVGHQGVLRVDGVADRVFIDGALWRAQRDPLGEPSAWHDGDHVVVERVNGLTLYVRRAEEWELES